jgi:hypothetical protein
MTRLALILVSTILVADRARATTEFDLEARKRELPWIWQTPMPQPVPETTGPAPASEVDRFLRARLEKAGVSPAPPADDLTWLRRVHFALTGLPPEQARILAFLAEAPGERRARAVDILLASPHFGERWARHWMDLVRYAESRGHEDDFPIANAWRYRDYLIRAFNADLPYDRLVAEHVAGDLLPPRLDPTTGANESVLATGWAFLGEENHSPVDIRLDECERVDNKIDVLSKTFLGLTVACARCHDHKFDAISQRDYHALAGIILSSPFRQVRFETMDSHARAAHQLEALRTEHAGAIARAFADAARSGTRQLAAHLEAARRCMQGDDMPPDVDPARVAAWTDHLKQALTEPEHPLHRLAGYASPASNAPVLGAPRPNEPTEIRTALPAGALLIADFTEPGLSPWKVDGPTFGTRPRQSGELLFGVPDRPIARVLTAGAAVREAFWNRLALSPGTEMDSGSLGAAARAGKTVLTPKFTLASGRLHYLLRGRATVYAGVDSHLMITGPLHGSLVASFDTGGRTAWVTHDLAAYAGHRAHLEIAPQDDAHLEILMVVDAVDSPTWRPDQPWLPESHVAQWADLAPAFQADALTALEALSTGRIGLPPRLATLANWLVQHPELTATSMQPVVQAAAEFFRRRDELASGLRWDSATAVSWADGTGVDDPLLVRGKPTRPGPPVPRGLPEAFGQPRITERETSGRAELARQMTDPANPLLARVVVNRVWHHLFGRGLVASVDNFGALGDRPTHPELLDHLSWQFVHVDQWSLKRLLRRLVLTEAYARSSRAGDPRAEERDPANELLHRMPVRRLEGEAIRDALLTVSGRLDPVLGGPPVPLHLTEFTIGRGSPTTSGPLDGAGRRSVYLAARRNFLPTFMLAFDFPTPFSTVGRRNVTNVPAQSLALMNDPMIREQAALWAARLLRELPAADDAARITWLFESAFSRPPTAAESAATAETLAELRALHTEAGDSLVWAELCHALVGTNDFIHLK